MRDITQRELELIQANNFDVACKIETEDELGNFVELTDLDGENWVENINISSNIDSDAIGCNISVIRDKFKKSLVYLMTQSKFNTDSNGDYSPLIDISRDIKIYFAIYNKETDPLQEAYFKEYFRGEINDITWDTNPINISCKDIIMNKLDYTQVEEEIEIGDFVDGEPISTEVPVLEAIQTILDETGTGYTIYNYPEHQLELDELSTEPYIVDKQSVRQALEEIYLAIGWRIRTRKIGELYRPTIMPVERQKEVEDYTFENYGNVRNYEKSNRDIRNKIKVFYQDLEGEKQSIVVQDNESIGKYGTRYMEIIEGSLSQINNSTRATALGNYALLDLKEPHLDKSLDVPFFPFVHIGDYYKFIANNVHSDVDHSFYVIGFNITFNSDNLRTTLDVRGQNTNKFQGWLNREARKGVQEPENEKAPRHVRNLNVFSDYGMLKDGTITTYIKAVWDRPLYVEYKYANVYLREQINENWTEWTRIDVVQQNEYTIRNIQDGTYELKVVTEDSNKNRTIFNESPSQVVDVVGKIDSPETVDFDEIIWKADKIKISWFPHSDPDFDQYELRLDDNFGGNH